MRIAIIGYGSLIWDLENLEPFTLGSWQIGTGPLMPVEFARISPKRKHGLVLVIDHTFAHQCKTSVIKSSRGTLDQAVDDLAARERCTANMIGSAHINDDDDQYSNWLSNNNFDAMIWTALPSNFKDKTGKDFGHQVAVEYLKTLNQDSLDEAWRYIEYAPEVTNTPFRQYLSSDKFWRSLSKEKR